jgi:RNase H-fold protein (predicted Holliday junction resolvase)
MDGSKGPSAQAARAFARNLLNVRDVPLLMWDERLSTAAVQRQMTGVSNATRGVMGGGAVGTSGRTAILNYITVATTGNATSFGNLTVARTSPAGVSGTIPT